MAEISSVASDNTNLVSGGAASAANLSYSPYPGKSAADTDTATMSFDDFLDMINPLEHIPVVSSVYRAVTGETINPVSRIAGDALYGGIFGLASAGLAALGAIGDEVVSANNGGKDISGTVVAALFGNDRDEDTQLASADTSTATDVNAASGASGTPTTIAATTSTAQSGTAVAANAPPTALTPSTTANTAMATATPQVVTFSSALQFALAHTPAPQRSPILDTPDFAAAAQPVAQMAAARTAAIQVASAQAVEPSDASAAASSTDDDDDDMTAPAAPAAAVAQTQGMPITSAAVAAAGKAMPLDRSKMPYGGVMDTAMMQRAQQNQTAALAMVGGASALQMQRSLRNSRFATNSTLTPTLSGTATNPMTTAAIQAPLNTQTQDALKNLMTELQASRGVNPYQTTAQSASMLGSTVNITN